MSIPAPPTKLVRVRLSGLVRMEYAELVEVPADASDYELNELVNKRYADVDGGQFAQDADYWERGECFAEPVEASNTNKPELRVTRGENGLEVASAPSGPIVPFLVADHYAHCFVGSRQVITRWVMDRRTREMLCGEAQQMGRWRDELDRVQLDDVREDIETNDVEENPADFDVRVTDVLPEWATQQMLDAARACGFGDEDESQAVLDFLHARAEGVSRQEECQRLPRPRG